MAEHRLAELNRARRWGHAPAWGWRGSAVIAALLTAFLAALGAVGPGPAGPAAVAQAVEDGVPVGGAAAPTAVPVPEWLEVVNLYRGVAGLPPVEEDLAASAAARAHARYLAVNRRATHDEDRRLPYATAAGARAGATGAVSLGPPTSDREMVENLLAAPFHGLGLLAPGARRFGFGTWEHGGREAATLTVFYRGPPAPWRHAAPVLWPGHGAGVPLVRYAGGEVPDPLTACRGAREPVGLPILVQLPPGSGPVTAATLRSGADVVPTCVLDAATYRNPNATAQARGRKILRGYRAAVVVPLRPLVRGRSYDVTAAHGSGPPIAWSFRITDGDVVPVAGSPLAGRPTPGRSAQRPLPPRFSGIRSSFAGVLRVEWTVFPDATAAPVERIEVEVLDASGRVVARETPDVSSTAATFEPAPSAARRVRVALYAGADSSVVELQVRT